MRQKFAEAVTLPTAFGTLSQLCSSVSACLMSFAMVRSLCSLLGDRIDAGYLRLVVSFVSIPPNFVTCVAADRRTRKSGAMLLGHFPVENSIDAV